MKIAGTRVAAAVLRPVWHAVRWIPGARPAAILFLQSTGLAEKFALALSPVPSPMSVELEEQPIDYNSSTYGQLRPYPFPSEDEYREVEQAYVRAKTDEPANIVFMSALMGNYESPQRHEHLIPEADYLLVCDGPVVINGPTTVVASDYYDIDPVRSARFVKTHPHLYAPHAGLVIWHDSNMIIRGDLRPLISDFMASGKPVGVVPHPIRSTVYEEADEVIKRNKDARKVVVEQMDRYRAENFKPERDSLIESGLMFLRMDMPETRRFLSLWWGEIDRGSRRDQLSVTYAAQKSGVEFFQLTQRPNSVRNHPAIALLHHTANLPKEDDKATIPSKSAFREPSDRPDRETADIIVCVHNALEVTEACLQSLISVREATHHRIIIVDDGSEPSTASSLRRFADSHPLVLLVRNETALGYTRAVNVGLRNSSAPFMILLNSDTIVSPGFVQKMAHVVRCKPGVGIVGPLSNAASVQSIPDPANRGSQTAVNELPVGLTPQDMDAWCEREFSGDFPRVPLVHGFCFGLTREAYLAIGEFDEENFPKGFGEENDYCFRAAHCGVGLAIATNTYVFHHKSKSYGESRRAAIAAASAERLRAMHGVDRVRRSILGMTQNPVLVRIRSAAATVVGSDTLETAIEQGTSTEGAVRDLLLLRLQDRSAIVGVIGLGYVGLPLSMAIARAGYRVKGFDIDPAKVTRLNARESYIGAVTSEELANISDRGLFEALEPSAEMGGCDVVIICVPTPLTRQREPDMQFVEATARVVANNLRRGQLVVLESTTYPGTTEELLRPILEQTGLKSGKDFYLAFSPEREDPGNPNFNTAAIPKVVGGDGPDASMLSETFYGAVVQRVVAVSSLKAAEATKITENVFRAVNIALVNELKVVYDAMGIDVWEVIDAAASKPFGYMPFYPGPGLGGHCIPIDPFYLTWKSREYGLPTRFIELAGEINVGMPAYVVKRLEEALDRHLGLSLGSSRVLIIGLSYKRNIADIRESPSIVLIELLQKRGVAVDFHDPFVAEIPPTREHASLAGRQSVPLSEEAIAAYDAVLISTDHDDVDYSMLCRVAKVIVDTRNAIGRRGLHAELLVKA